MVSDQVKISMTQLWLRMSEIYGAQFANQYGEVGGESFQTWCLGLRDMTEGMIKKGFVKLLKRESQFVPNLGEFRKLCMTTPEEFGLPSTEAAYLEACNNGHRVLHAKWTHPAVYYAGKNTGWFELRSETSKVTRPRFKAEYEALCDRVMNGEVLELPELNSRALEHHRNGRKVATQQAMKAGNAALAELRRRL